LPKFCHVSWPLGFAIVLALSACHPASLSPSQMEPWFGEKPDGPNLSLDSGRDLIVRLKPGIQSEQVATLVGSLATASLSETSGILRLRLAQGRSLVSSIETLKQSGLVVYAEANQAFSLPASTPDFGLTQTRDAPDDPYYDRQWNFPQARIDQAWTRAKGNPAITIAVIDSGVDPNHPDLVDSLEPLEDVYREEKGEDIYRQNARSSSLNFDGRDGNGHGTHVAGIIAATLNNGIGVAGVAGGGVRILPIKATDYAGRTDAATLTAAFQRAIDRGANVINISIGGPAEKSTRALSDMVQLAMLRGISVVAASGNDSQRQRGNTEALSVPAAYTGVIAVGAHTEFGQVAHYSNGGPELDLVAPGGGGQDPLLKQGRQIWSTWPVYPTVGSSFQSSSYAWTSGTSMACPHVSGVIALMLALEPKLSPAQIRSRLIATADDIGPAGFDEASGYGQLNAYRALQWSRHDARD
jgi:serine protease